MKLYNDLIDFLTEKVNKINYAHKKANDKLEVISIDKYQIITELDKELINHKKRQNQIEQLLLILLDLVQIKLKTNNNGYDALEKEVNSYLNFFIQKVIIDELKFNTNHPFFGFTFFHEKLINELVKSEAYEKCNEITLLTSK